MLDHRPPEYKEAAALAHLREREADALIISGSEADVCVLATVLSAVDLGYRVIVVRDACAARQTRDTTCCCASITPVLASRSRQPMPRRSCRGGINDREPVR